ncbi:MAG: ATP-binding protein [Deltaproteobacteria bacterium]|nr:ATP-binding protein [Deltaproteobacteria bacterium]
MQITIADQGVGIPEDHLNKLFDPYFSTKPMGVQKGMGLGLATAYANVKKHGGNMAFARMNAKWSNAPRAKASSFAWNVTNTLALNWLG